MNGPARIPAPTVITAHVNADFDALASMIAAGKLYPEAVLVFPGSQEKNLKNFFIQSATYLFNFKAAKDVDQTTVRTLVVVDTRQRSRVVHMAQALDNHGLTIHVYDHHPESDEDLPADFADVRPWGSTTTIMVEHIRERNLSLTPDEATILALGIYEDTGCFTFTSTTSHEFMAAAWLSDQGMDLNMVSDMVNRDLNAEQISILNDLLDSAVTHRINGVDVIIAEVTLDRYVGDFALLAHKLLDMENIRVLFALGRMQDRIQVVARSRNPEFDVGQICSSLGGGGHAFAASASIKDRTLSQVKDELFGLLYSLSNPQLEVKTLMSAPVVSVDKTRTLQQAAETMTRFGLKAVPVVDPGTEHCVGILEHQVAEKAVAHGLGPIQIREYMLRDVASVTPEDDLYRVMEIILGQRQRLVPVIEDGRLAGVLTRTDLINILVKEPSRFPESLIPGRQQERNVTRLMQDRLPRDIHDLLIRAGRIAESMGCELFCVGGFVRDILLGLPNTDIDLVVESDGIVFAHRLADEIGGRVRPHIKFKTAVVILDDGRKIDVATARLEYYEYPAALPTVELSSIKMDLFRRDFTINALAVHLNPARLGTLVDFFGGQQDMKNRAIRVLHSLSFVEDPTRIIRAIRFEQRFGFTIGKQTERLIKNAMDLGIFHRLSGARILHEFQHLLEEKDPLACLDRMNQFQLLEAIHPKLQLTQNRRAILTEISEVVTWYRLLYREQRPEIWLLYLLGLCSGMDEDETRAMAARLNFTTRQTRNFLGLRESVKEVVGRIFNWQQGPRLMSELVRMLEQMSLEGVLFIMARSRKDDTRKAISLYLTRFQGLATDVKGQDLKDLGLRPGPVFGRIMNAIKDALLDERVKTREEQLALAKDLAAASRDHERSSDGALGDAPPA
ncbi:MAG: CBS domain-containing protein [Deltaproteobacteria bacterium]|nr:CBS domain-containing protein [Deltaproteobacteria bacterium]